MFNELTSKFAIVKGQFVKEKYRLLVQDKILKINLNKHGRDLRKLTNQLFD